MSMKTMTGFGLAMASAFAAHVAGATTWYVSPYGADTNDGKSAETAFATPAKGIQVAEAGDTVLLAAGTYTMGNRMCADVNMWRRPLTGTTLTGATGNPRDVVLDFQGLYTGIELASGAGFTVSSLTVSNGMMTAEKNWGDTGTGINTGNAQARTSETPNLVTNCIVTCCESNSRNRRAALLVDANARAVDCLVTGNTNTSKGGAVLLLNGGELVNCTVEGNAGPGVWGEVNNGTNATGMVMRDCTVRDNAGSGVQNVLTVRDCRVEGNRSLAGAGIMFSQDILKTLPADFRVTVSNTVFLGNVATNYGGAISWGSPYAVISNLVVDSCQFLSNVCVNVTTNDTWGGGAIHVNANTVNGENVIRNSLFDGNVQLASGKPLPGAALHVTRGASQVSGDGSIRIESCTFAGNRNESGHDSSVYLTGRFGTPIAYVTNCTFASNLKVADGAETEVAGLETRSGYVAYSYLWPEQGGTYADTVINGTKAPRFLPGTRIPGPGSPLRDRGVTLDWMAGAKDLQRDADGRAFRDRVVGAAPDIGCYESWPLGLFLIVR